MRRLPDLAEVVEATGLSAEQVKGTFPVVNVNGTERYCGDELYRLAAAIESIRRVEHESAKSAGKRELRGQEPI